MRRLMLPHPISVNRAYRNFRGMTVKSKEAHEYQSTIKAIAYSEGYREPLEGPIHVEMSYHPRRPKKYAGGPVRSLDLDNVLKVAVDSLNGVAWQDDKQITHLSICKGEPVEGGALVISWRSA